MTRALHAVEPAERETISLVVSPQGSLQSVITLVAGGVGGRLELPVDQIDDLQLALTTLLRRLGDDKSISVVFEPDARGVSCRLGPLDGLVVAVLPTVTKLVSFLASDERQDGSLGVTLRVDAKRPGARPASGVPAQPIDGLERETRFRAGHDARR